MKILNLFLLFFLFALNLYADNKPQGFFARDKTCIKKPFHDCIGTAMNPENFDIYEGEWKNGIPHGSGKITHPDGGVTELFFKDGKKHGPFIKREFQGTVTKGSYRDGLRSGPMTVSYKSGKYITYTYKDDQPVGMAKEVFTSGKEHYYDCDKRKRESDGSWTCPLTSKNY